MSLELELRGKPNHGDRAFRWLALGAADLVGDNPRFTDFLAQRDRLDPNRVFANDHLRRLLGDCGERKVHLIVDGHRVHRAKLVSAWVAGHAERIELHVLPGYSPELNRWSC